MTNKLCKKYEIVTIALTNYAEKCKVLISLYFARCNHLPEPLPASVRFVLRQQRNRVQGYEVCNQSVEIALFDHYSKKLK